MILSNLDHDKIAVTLISVLRWYFFLFNYLAYMTLKMCFLALSYAHRCVISYGFMFITKYFADVY